MPEIEALIAQTPQSVRVTQDMLTNALTSQNVTNAGAVAAQMFAIFQAQQPEPVIDLDGQSVESGTRQVGD